MADPIWDVNGDGVVNIKDVGTITKFVLTCDFNKDGKVDLEDVKTLLNHYDLNGDGIVDIQDIQLLLKHLYGIQGIKDEL